MNTQKITRRQFLKIMGTAGLASIPPLLGYGWIATHNGEYPQIHSPYAPPDDEGLSKTNPILLLVHEHSENPFGQYLQEILFAEGLNCFSIAFLSKIKPDALKQFDTVILAEGLVSSSQVDWLSQYVASGGNLIAMRPEPALDHLFGVASTSGSISDGYLQIESNRPEGQGIIPEPIQFHGSAALYKLENAAPLAWLSKDDIETTTYPAVTLNRFEQGQTSLWAFDLARSVAYTRQGNPNWANQERDGFREIRATDMFKDWLDMELIANPQADEQQRLLANLLNAFSQNGRPLPRFWYFPNKAESVFIATSDSHQNSGKSVNEYCGHVEKFNGQTSIYYLPPIFDDFRLAAQKGRWLAEDLSVMDQAYLPSPKQIANLRSKGHEFSVHPEVIHGLEEDWQAYWKAFTGLGYGPIPPTIRTHCILWSDWTETARFQASLGFGLNLDYYHIGPMFKDKTGDWAFGHFTGSGLPMKFIDEQGQILNIYQQVTQLADDHILDLHWGGVAKLPPDEAVKTATRLIERSTGNSAITANFHTDPFDVGGESAEKAAAFLDGTLAAAAERNVPIWTAERWLRFTETRHDSVFNQLEWKPSERKLIIRINCPQTTADRLSFMLPLHHNSGHLAAIEVDGNSIVFANRSVGGVEYGCTLIDPGIHEVIGYYSA